MEHAELIVVDAYYGVFDALTDALLKNRDDGKRKIVFCEEKVSLMAERRICAALGGTFDTEVYSFGNFMRSRKNPDSLSKEGAAMACKRILANLPLCSFARSKNNLAPSVAELIAQLKSAKISPESLLKAASFADGILSDKLRDIAAVFSEYEKFLEKRNLKDQNSLLDDLPNVIRKDEEILEAEVYIVGYPSWTAQAREIVSALLDSALSLTAILVGGDNRFLYLNETVDAFTCICKEKRIKLNVERRGVIPTDEGVILSKKLFSPRIAGDKAITDKVFFTDYRSPKAEIESVAATIKTAVIEKKARYRDFTVCAPSFDDYGEEIKNVFSDYEIPFFLDEKKKPLNNPLITLIISYCDVFIKNFERNAVRSFFSNPLFSEDKKFNDAFYSYVLTYGINYSSLKKPFTLGADREDFKKLEKFRTGICSFFGAFDETALLERLSVKEKIQRFCEKLEKVGETESAKINEQIYDKVTGIIFEMRSILGDKITPKDFKTVFLSGVNALELSIIPQYQDAVFVGGYKETAFAAANYLFAVGLTSDVPNAKDDVALITDGDISRLKELKLMLEPKIKVVNDREKECVGNALTAFKKALFISYPVCSKTGDTNLKSDVAEFVKRAFTVRTCRIKDDYLTEKQGLKSFAKECGDYLDGRIKTLGRSQSYYVLKKEKAEPILKYADRDMKVRLTGDRSLVGDFVAPTRIENFYRCPYKAFLADYLKIDESDKGEVNPASVGTFIHEVFGLFVKDLKRGADEKAISALIEKEINAVAQKEEYKKYAAAEENAFSFNIAKTEAEKFCRKIAAQYFRSRFENLGCETDISKPAGEITPITLNGATLSGRIDRADGYVAESGDKYLRIIDYKTGAPKNVNADLFAGKGLQLFLYANAYKNRSLAGAYYYAVDDGFKSEEDKGEPVTVGKTLDSAEIVNAQDDCIMAGNSDFLSLNRQGKVDGAVSGEEMESYKKYALLMAEQAVAEMKDGKIIPSPLAGECEYCPYKGMCENAGEESRKVSLGRNGGALILGAVKGKEI